MLCNRHFMKNKRMRQSAFTLVEVLISMVIVGILVSIAYPSYLQYIQKSRRADAHATLTQDQIILERCYSQNFLMLWRVAPYQHFLKQLRTGTILSIFQT